MPLCLIVILYYDLHSPGIFLFRVNNENTRVKGEIWSKLFFTVWHHWLCSDFLIVNMEETSHIVLVFQFVIVTLSKKIPAD